jgi:general secretion pathway protein F
VSVVEYNLLSDKPVSTHRLYKKDERRASSIEHRADVFRRTSARDICVLTRQLATLLHAGMPLVPALSALVEQMQGDSLSQIMKEIRDSVNAGSSFAGALGKHPGVFSNLFVNMVAAGETSGTLEEVLLRLAEILDKRAHLAGKVKSVIAYPLMLTVVAVGVVMFLLSFVVPSITQIFLEINRQLPWPTRLLISTSAFMKTYLLVIIAAVCVMVFGIGAWVRTEEGRIVWDRSKLRMPLFGKLFLKLEISRLTRTLGILLASGIPVLSALEITKGVVQNRFIAGTLGSVKDLVGKGDNIADAVRNTGLFPPIVFHIIATGQISGDIEGGLLSIADMYDGEVEMMAKTLTSLLEPAIVLAMGAVVGFIVLAILLPIFEINQVL